MRSRPLKSFLPILVAVVSLGASACAVHVRDHDRGYRHHRSGHHDGYRGDRHHDRGDWDRDHRRDRDRDRDWNRGY